MLALTMMNRYSVGKSDVWISGTLALALVYGKRSKKKREKMRNFPLIGVSLAIKLFFTKQADVFWSKTLFKPISVCF